MDLEITATSDDGSSSTEIFTINILDANEAGVGPISDTNTDADQVSEDAANGTFVGITAFADDPDTSDQVTYSLSNNAGGAFAINATTGEVSVADTILLIMKAINHLISKLLPNRLTVLQLPKSIQ